MSWYDDYYKPYVPVAQRRAQAAREVARRIKKGEAICPVVIEGRAIASSFWGKAWCDHLESYSDYANRLPRGRTYVRNGSVVHLAIEAGRIKALVSGSSMYEIQIHITPLAPAVWQTLKSRCSGQIGTIVELLQGKLSKAVMETVTDRDQGLFPKPREVRMRCSCPDGAGMCKHLAAVLFGVGSRLDSAPELLFKLRSVNHVELIAQTIPTAPVPTKGKAPQIATADLGDIFGIEFDDAPQPPHKAPTQFTAKPAPMPRVAAKKAAPTQKDPAKMTPAKKVPAKKAPVAAAKKAPVAAAKKPIPTPKAPVAAEQPPARSALKALLADPVRKVAPAQPAPTSTVKQAPASTVKQAPAVAAQPVNPAPKAIPARKAPVVTGDQAPPPAPP